MPGWHKLIMEGVNFGWLAVWVVSKSSQVLHPDFKIVSVSIFPCLTEGVCYRAQRCSQTQEWLTDKGTWRKTLYGNSTNTYANRGLTPSP
jgi:hypothetical protein